MQVNDLEFGRVMRFSKQRLERKIQSWVLWSWALVSGRVYSVFSVMKSAWRFSASPRLGEAGTGPSLESLRAIWRCGRSLGCLEEHWLKRYQERTMAGIWQRWGASWLLAGLLGAIGELPGLAEPVRVVQGTRQWQFVARNQANTSAVGKDRLMWGE